MSREGFSKCERFVGKWKGRGGEGGQGPVLISEEVYKSRTSLLRV